MAQYLWEEFPLLILNSPPFALFIFTSKYVPSIGEAQGSIQQAQRGAQRGGHRLHQRQKQALQQEDEEGVRQVHRGDQTKHRAGNGALRPPPFGRSGFAAISEGDHMMVGCDGILPRRGSPSSRVGHSCRAPVLEKTPFKGFRLLRRVFRSGGRCLSSTISLVVEMCTASSECSLLLMV